MDDYERAYRLAATLIETGWVRTEKGALRPGKPCMMDAVLVASGSPEGQDALPAPVQLELHDALRRRPYYRLLNAVNARSGAVSVPHLIAAWNDAFWRRRRTLVAVLNWLADGHRAQSPGVTLTA